MRYCSSDRAADGSIPSSCRGLQLLEGRERLGVPSLPVEREHQLAARALAQRLARHERLQLRRDVRVAAEREVRVDSWTGSALLAPLGTTGESQAAGRDARGLALIRGAGSRTGRQ